MSNDQQPKNQQPKPDVTVNTGATNPQEFAALVDRANHGDVAAAKRIQNTPQATIDSWRK